MHGVMFVIVNYKYVNGTQKHFNGDIRLDISAITSLY